MPRSPLPEVRSDIEPKAVRQIVEHVNARGATLGRDDDTLPKLVALGSAW
jgi:hypothetical protein